MLVLMISIAQADDEADCQGFNPGSAITTCDELDICCSNERCWMQYADGDIPGSVDEALDSLCVFQDYGFSPLLVDPLNLKDNAYGFEIRSRWNGNWDFEILQ